MSKLSSRLPASERAHIKARLQAANNIDTWLDDAEARLWDWYAGKPYEMEAKRVITAYTQLYRICAPGSTITCVFIRASAGASITRVWKVVAPYGNRVSMLTAYLITLGIGNMTRNEHEIELSTQSDAAEIAYHLSSELYGDGYQIHSTYF